MNNNPQIDPTTLLPVGTLLQGGKYKVEKYLSSGNFGNTYIVIDMASGQRRAMKEFFLRGYCYRTNMRLVTMSPAVAPDRIAQHREKFKKEAHRMYALKGDHVVHIYDLFDENNTTYYVMDYVEGESLADYMEHTGRPLTEEQTLYILNQVLDALEEVHQQKIWHLDLKPDNMMIDRQGKVVIIDFGASKQIGASGKYTGTTGVLCYTPGYAPVEQMGQDMASIGPWTDIYALGATLYNLLTNIVPTMQAPETLTYPQPVSKKMRDLITWMMNIDRAKRPQSIAAVRGYLNYSSQQQQQQQQRPPIRQTFVDQSIRISDDQDDQDDGRSSKRKWIILGIVGGVVLLAVILLVALSGGSKDERYNWDDAVEVADEYVGWDDDDEAEGAVVEEDDDDYWSRQESESQRSELQAAYDSIQALRQEAEDLRRAAEADAAAARERAAQAERDRQAAQLQAERDRLAAQRQQEAQKPSVTWTKTLMEHNVMNDNRQMLKVTYSLTVKNNRGHNVKVYAYVYRSSDNSVHKWAGGGDMCSASSVMNCQWDTSTFTDWWVGFYNDSLNPLSGSNEYYVRLWAKDETTGEWLQPCSDKLTYTMTGN